MYVAAAVWQKFGLIVITQYFFNFIVIPDVTHSFEVPPAPFLGYPVVQQYEAPVNLFVELTADPCPDVEWFFNGVHITEANAAPPDNTSNITLFTVHNML